ncbi:MAG TPA: hypothetical protein VHD37_02230 [Candidatus Paceibacterota bacterium]|nr:hypothetical protein [Candidatus Paceibacterota bacterium]
MTRRILYIIIGAALILALILGLWFWFFSRGAQEAAGPNGLFGSSGDRTDTSGGTASDQGNGQTPIPDYTASQPIPAGPDQGQASGAVWLDGSNAGSGSGGGGGGGGSGSGGGGGSNAGGGTSVQFVPTPINSFNSFNPEGTIYIALPQNGAGGGNSLISGLLGVAGGCVANFLATKATGAVASAIDTVTGLFKVQVTDSATHGNQVADSVIQCIVRGLARAAIQQITNDTINWINSGFNGQPAFVQDYNKFFSNVADQAAGSVIQGGDFAFLCSPFQLKVRIALAQSYARRSSAPSCSLSQVVGNVENFVNGSFSEGGWPGFLEFTTEPTNNPFGAYMYGQLLVNGRVAADTRNAQLKLSPGGFLSQEKCDLDANGTSIQDTCHIETPGSQIEAVVEKSVGTSIDELELANSIDDILNALMNALITKVLYKGLSNLGGSGSDSLEGTQDVAATEQANTLLAELQTRVSDAQSYASTEQGSAADVQAAQDNLNTLENCWLGSSSSKAKGQAAKAADQITSLEDDVALHNSRITAANVAIASLQGVQTQLLSASTMADVQAAASAYASLKAGGTLITPAQVTTAQQDRTTLQSQLASVNTNTQSQLQTCYAAS